MTVHFFTKGDRNTASSRQRAFILAEKLEERGIGTKVHHPSSEALAAAPWPGKWALLRTFIEALAEVKKGDVVFVQRAIYSKYLFLGLLLHKLIFRPTFIFDLDDAIFLHSPRKACIFASIADHVFVGSHYLKEWAERYARSVTLVPTALDPRPYTRQEISYEMHAPVVLGWMGNGPAHYENLALLVPVVRTLSERAVPVTLTVVGSLGSEKVKALFAGIGGVEVTFVDSLVWADPDAVPRALSRFDIGLMPLIDTPWSRGKCAFKAIEYMACGIPSILSAVGENNYLIQHGENGFLARDTAEWVDAIMELAGDPALRERVGRAGQRTVQEAYSFDAIVPQVLAIIRE